MTEFAAQINKLLDTDPMIQQPTAITVTSGVSKMIQLVIDIADAARRVGKKELVMDLFGQVKKMQRLSPSSGDPPSNMISIPAVLRQPSDILSEMSYSYCIYRLESYLGQILTK